VAPAPGTDQGAARLSSPGDCADGNPSWQPVTQSAYPSSAATREKLRAHAAEGCFLPSAWLAEGGGVALGPVVE
jgi:hypothetical protein